MDKQDLTDKEWALIEPLLPNKTRGVKRVDDRKILNGIFWRIRQGCAWAKIPPEYGQFSTCYNRFIRWERAGVWQGIFETLAQSCDSSIWSLDSTIVRVHQHGANAKKKDRERLLLARRKPGRSGRSGALAGD